MDGIFCDTFSVKGDQTGNVGQDHFKGDEVFAFAGSVVRKKCVEVVTNNLYYGRFYGIQGSFGVGGANIRALQVFQTIVDDRAKGVRGNGGFNAFDFLDAQEVLPIELHGIADVGRKG